MDVSNVYCEPSLTCLLVSLLSSILIPQPEGAEGDCSRALELEPDNIKALYRRGVARKVTTKH